MKKQIPTFTWQVPFLIFVTLYISPIFVSTKILSENLKIPDEATIPSGKDGEFVRYGKLLITETYKYLGPESKNPSLRFAGNNLSCSNCHLDAGTRAHAIPYVGVHSVYPQYKAREGTISTLEDRINGCMERSMSGRALPKHSNEMYAMLSYMKWLSRGIAVSETGASGTGLKRIPRDKFPNAPLDMEHGKAVYQKQCVQCHQANGGGLRKGKKGDGEGYAFPPLWGSDSYNDGAGMHRNIFAASFIYYHMPQGTRPENPILTIEEAFNVAGYINSRPRPQKTNKERDFPNLSEKPVDAPFGPYADEFSKEQHKNGPWGVIIQARERKKTK